MNRQSLIAGAFAVALVAAVLGGILYSTRRNKVELSGKVLQVRTHQIDPENTIAVIDFRAGNPSTQQFVVRKVEVMLDRNGSEPLEGDIIAEVDARRVFEYYPILGRKHNATLVTRDKIEPGQTLDRMIAARFSTSDQRLQERKALRVIVRDVDGAASEIVEQK